MSKGGLSLFPHLRPHCLDFRVDLVLGQFEFCGRLVSLLFHDVILEADKKLPQLEHSLGAYLADAFPRYAVGLADLPQCLSGEIPVHDVHGPGIPVQRLEKEPVPETPGDFGAPLQVSFAGREGIIHFV